jgi:hypothetical protein
MDELLKTFVFKFNPHVNRRGSVISFTTKFYNHNNSVDFDQEFSLDGAGNSAHICLSTCKITPEILRKLADELEVAEKECKQIIQKRIDSEKSELEF